jgi:hypothetical protein
LKTLLWNSFYAVLFPGCFLFLCVIKNEAMLVTETSSLPLTF